MVDNRLREIYSYHKWRHSIPLGEGHQTPGRITADLWDFVGFPNDLDGKSFLDIGSNDGLFSFMAEQKGASYVVSSDLYKDDLDTMRNGWSLRGISLAKEYLNSKIQIHPNGVYHLDEFNEKFDWVVVNSIINWLDNIESAIENLCNVTKGTLVISDGFLKDKKEPKMTAGNESLRHLYNVKFIENLLYKYGFQITFKRKLNYQKRFFEKYLNATVLTLKTDACIFQFPEGPEIVTKEKGKKFISDGFQPGYYHVYNVGWIKTDDVVVTKNNPSILYNTLKSIGLEGLYFQRMRINSEHRNLVSYTIYAQPFKDSKT